jgi:hypothetical protein
MLVVVLAVAPARAAGPWRPTGELAFVRVVNACDETAGDVMVSRLDPPTVYVCPRVVALVRKHHAGAEHFFFAHEFGHIALQTSDEAGADCWAARELALVPRGRRSLDAAIALFRARQGEHSQRYGTALDRAERIRRCADEALP